MSSALLRNIAASAVILYLAFVAMLYLCQRAIIYPGAKIRVGAVPVAAGIEVLKFASASGPVESLFLPALAGSGRNPLVIFAHGNGEVADYWVSALDGFRKRGIGVLLVEYPGYGRSAGIPSEASIRAALDAAYDRIATDPRVDSTRIFGYGQSLGGGAICLLARDRPLRALILQSTFPSLAIFPARYYAPAFLLRDYFDNRAALASYPGPVLVIHGRQDQVIPWQYGRALAAASAHASFHLYDCGHVCWDPEHLPFWRDVEPFLIEAGILQHPEKPQGAGLAPVPAAS